MAEDIWSKDRPLNLEKIAECFKGLGFSSTDLNKMVAENYPKGLGLGKCASETRIPTYNSGVSADKSGEYVNTVADDSKTNKTAEVVPNVSPNMNVTNTVPNATPGSNMPGTSGQQQKVASFSGLGLGKLAEASVPTQSQADNQVLQQTEDIKSQRAQAETEQERRQQRLEKAIGKAQSGERASDWRKYLGR